MRVLPVAHFLSFTQLQIECAREVVTAITDQSTKVVGDGAVVSRRVLEGLYGKVKTGLKSGVTVVGIKFFEQARVIAGIHDNDHIPMVFGRRSHHGGTTNINILDRIFQAAVGARYGALEGIQIDHDHIDGVDAMGRHDVVVRAPASQNTAVNFRVEGLYSAVHHLGKARVFRHFGHRDTGFLQQPTGTAGGK